VEQRGVPWRTIWATIASVAAAALLVVLAMAVSRILIWLVVAVVLAVALNPAVDLLVRRARMRRGLAATVVVLLGVAIIAGLVFAFVRPLVEQGSEFADDLPEFVDDAEHGRGPVGDLVQRYDLADWVREQRDQLQGDIGQLGSQSLAVLGTIGSAIAASVTVFVLTFMILIEGNRIAAGVLSLVPDRHRDHVARVGSDCARAVTGYVTGNLLLSVIAGGTSFVAMLATGTPFAGLLALWVGITDLIPLVGALLGAVVVVLVALLHDPTAAIVMAVFFLVYQQLENHLLQPAVQSRTVKLNPLTVLVSALIGVELGGFLGALLAIPVAGVITVIIRDVHLGMREELRGVTVGAVEEPVDADDHEPAFVERSGDDVIAPEERADRLAAAAEPTDDG
jgi:predicted PurR-regulated permease PerM